MAHAWKACWCNSLGGSNPPSSASRTPLDPRSSEDRRSLRDSTPPKPRTSVGARGHVTRAHLIEAVRNGVEIFVEEVRVRGERHRRGGVAEHALHGLHVGACADREARGGVPEVVDRDPGKRRVELHGLVDRAHEPTLLVCGRPRCVSPSPTTSDSRRLPAISIASPAAGNSAAARYSSRASSGCRPRCEWRPSPRFPPRVHGVAAGRGSDAEPRNSPYRIPV